MTIKTGTQKTIVINGVKCLKKGVKDATGKYSPCWYSHGTMTDGKQAIVIYARSILKDLPRALGNVKNDTDSMTDYFESDRIRFNEGTPEYAALLPLTRHV